VGFFLRCLLGGSLFNLGGWEIEGNKMDGTEEIEEIGEMFLLREWKRRLLRYRVTAEELLVLGGRGGKADSEEWLIMSACLIL